MKVFYTEYNEDGIHHKYLYYVTDEFFLLPLEQQNTDTVDDYICYRPGDLPNWYMWSHDGFVTERSFIRPDQEHCLHGPSSIEYYPDGTIWRVGYAINGFNYETKEEWEEAVKNYRVLK